LVFINAMSSINMKGVSSHGFHFLPHIDISVRIKRSCKIVLNALYYCYPKSTEIDKKQLS
jgi:hypothetical protein